MNLRVNYKINKLPGIYVRNLSLRRYAHSPSKGLRNVKTFEILKKAEKTAVLLVSPETGRLPEAMGNLARYISGKAGGLGEVVSALCEGLRSRGIDCHLATLNLKKRFQRENNVDETAWREIRNKVDPDKVHFVSSSIFANLLCAYAGNPPLNAAEFQKEVVNNIIKTVRAKYGGRMILHSHDWMAGGVVDGLRESERLSGAAYRAQCPYGPYTRGDAFRCGCRQSRLEYLLFPRVWKNMYR